MRRSTAGYVRGMATRPYLRRLGLGLATVLGIARRGFFIPYRYADTVSGCAGDEPYEAVAASFRESEEDFLDVVHAISDYAADLDRIGADPPPAPRWDQDWFPRLDGAAAYAIVRRRRPTRIVEVGAGHSTRFFARAVEDEHLKTAMATVDPAPRATVEMAGVMVRRATVQAVGLAPFTQLEPGDMLSIDSSHVLMPGTDVDFLLNVVLPRPPDGVLVHIHDVFLPDGYPPEWEWRGYNEQLAVALLLQGGRYRVLWSSHYVSTRLAAALDGTVISRLPLVPGARESSLWLRKG